MRLFLPLVSMLALSSFGAHAAAPAGSNPAPMNGIWQLSSFSDTSAPTVGLLPAGQLMIVSGAVRGNAACARFQGTLTAARNEVRIQAEQLPPPANVRCAFTVRGSLGAALNEVSQYTLTRKHLVLFSDKVRLTFDRIGYVTPANK